MLYIISGPMSLDAGHYTCRPISAAESTELIKTAAATNTMRSFVRFKSTANEIRALTGVNVALASTAELPTPENGDTFLDVRLKPVPKGKPIEMADLDFWKIDFQRRDYENIKDSAEWPLIVR